MSGPACTPVLVVRCVACKGTRTLPPPHLSKGPPLCERCGMPMVAVLARTAKRNP